MRCLSPDQQHHPVLFWILLATAACQLCNPTAAAQPADGAGPPQQQQQHHHHNHNQQQAPQQIPSLSAGNYDDSLGAHIKTIASMSQRWPAGGGNTDINPKCDLLFANKSLSMTELADSSATATDTFDGGGREPGAGTGEWWPSAAVLSQQQQRNYGEHVRKTGRAEEDEDLDVEESRFNEFAIGTLNQHQHQHHHQLTALSHPHVEKGRESKLATATSTGMIMVSGAGGGESVVYDKGRIGQDGEEEVDQVVASSRKRPPPVMVPTTEDEIDDERIFYDIVDSKHLISRLGSSGLPRPGGLMMGLSLAAFSSPAMQRGGSEAPSSSKSAPSHGGGGGEGRSAKGSGMNADGSCHIDDPHCSEMEAIQSLHKKLDDDANGNIDISESTDFLRQELKYDSGYENRHRVFHFNDDMHISVRELWEAWRRSEVHNWTVAQTTEWLAQSVQLPQYVELFKQHKVTGAYLPRLAVDNMQYLTSVLGIKDHIHKQKIALKAMDVVLFGPPRETGTRWKDYILVTLLLSVIVGCWYGYQQNKNSKTHLRRMAKDMEGLQKAEQALTEMQKELERARLEQENVATEKMDLERRLKETPSLSTSSSDLEVQQLKQEIDMLRRELSRAEIELVDHCWSPPQGLQTWLQLTYELESKSHQTKRRLAEKQLLAAREACEKLKRKRTSLVGAFVSTHGKSIDDVDRSIVEARTSLSEVTNELQERMHRWKQIEQILGFNIVNNNGIAHLETILYARNNGSTMGSKMSRGNRMSSSQDELDDESVQGRQYDSLDRSLMEDSSASEENEINASGAKFIVGGSVTPTTTAPVQPSVLSQQSLQMFNSLPGKTPGNMSMAMFQSRLHSAESLSSLSSSAFDENRSTAANDRVIALGTRGKKATSPTAGVPTPPPIIGRTPMPPPRKSGGHLGSRAQSTDVVSLDAGNWPAAGSGSSTVTTPGSIEGSSHNSSRSVSLSGNKLVHQLSTTSNSTSSNESVPVNTVAGGDIRIGTETPPSTDSSVVDDEVKKRRRKLHFPFGKRNKNKGSSSSTSTK